MEIATLPEVLVEAHALTTRGPLDRLLELPLVLEHDHGPEPREGGEQLQRAAGLGRFLSFVVAPLHRQHLRQRPVGRGVARIQLDGSAGSLLGGFRVPVPEERHVRFCTVHLRYARIYRKRGLDELLHVGQDPTRVHQPEEGRLPIGLGQESVGRGEARVQLDRPLEKPLRVDEPLSRPEVQGVSTPVVEVEDRRVLPAGGETIALLGTQGRADLVRDGPGHAAGDGKCTPQVGLVVLGPERPLRRGGDQSNVEREGLSLPLYRALDQGVHVQLRRDGRERQLRVAEAEHAGAGDHADASDLAELADESRVDAVDEVHLLRVAGEVLEWDHGQSPDRWGPVRLLDPGSTGWGVTPPHCVKVEEEIIRALVTRVGFLTQEPAHDRPEAIRQVVSKRVDGLWLVVEDRLYERHLARSLEGSHSGEHLVEHDAQ